VISDLRANLQYEHRDRHGGATPRHESAKTCEVCALLERTAFIDDADVLTPDRDVKAVDVLATALNVAQIECWEIQLGRDLRRPATRLHAALRDRVRL
jgi:hypothetical protein